MSENNLMPYSGNPYGVAPAPTMSMNDQSVHSGGNALAANEETRAIAEVKAQVIVSKQYPRSPYEASEKILEECKRPTLAEAAVYSYPRGRETVTGPSIRLAEVMARAWGNNTFGWEVLDRKRRENGIGYSIIRAFAWDLETNTYIRRQFTVEHYRQTKNGGYPLTDDRDIYEMEANMAARRLRACILQMIPGDVTSMAVAACRKTSSSGLAEGMKDSKSRQKLIVGTLKVYEKMGIKQEDLEGYLNSRTDDWTADDMLKLKELKNSIDDNVSSIGDIFPHLAPPEQSDLITKEQVEELMGLAKQTGRQGEISDIMKKQGIAKYADIPANIYDNVKEIILNMIPKEDPETPAENSNPPETAK